MSKKVSKKVVLRLLIAEQPSADDEKAVALLRARYNGQLSVISIAPPKSEVLPQLWYAQACYRGLDSISKFLDAQTRRGNPALSACA